jgi:alpha-mannosidase
MLSEPYVTNADTYNSDASISDIVACSSRNKTPDAAPDVLLLYGHGDGGGGPTDDMVPPCASTHKQCNSLSRYSGLVSCKTLMA